MLSQGLEWVAKNHIKPAVVHMSIEGAFSSIVNQAVEQLIKVNHVHVVVSSGGHRSQPVAGLGCRQLAEAAGAGATSHSKWCWSDQRVPVGRGASGLTDGTTPFCSARQQREGCLSGLTSQLPLSHNSCGYR